MPSRIGNDASTASCSGQFHAGGLLFASADGHRHHLKVLSLFLGKPQEECSFELTPFTQEKLIVVQRAMQELRAVLSAMPLRLWYLSFVPSKPDSKSVQYPKGGGKSLTYDHTETSFQSSILCLLLTPAESPKVTIAAGILRV